MPAGQEPTPWPSPPVSFSELLGARKCLGLGPSVSLAEPLGQLLVCLVPCSKKDVIDVAVGCHGLRSDNAGAPDGNACDNVNAKSFPAQSVCCGKNTAVLEADATHCRGQIDVTNGESQPFELAVESRLRG